MSLVRSVALSVWLFSAYVAFLHYQQGGLVEMLNNTIGIVLVAVILSVVALAARQFGEKQGGVAKVNLKAILLSKVFVVTFCFSAFSLSGMESNATRDEYLNLSFLQLNDNQLFSEVYWSMRDNPTNGEFSDLQIGLTAREILAEEMSNKAWRSWWLSFQVFNSIVVAFFVSALYRLVMSKVKSQSANVLQTSNETGADSAKVDDLYLFLASYKHERLFLKNIYTKNYNFYQIEVYSQSSNESDLDRAKLGCLLDLAKLNYEKVTHQYRECSETAIVAMSINQMIEEIECEITSINYQISELNSAN